MKIRLAAGTAIGVLVLNSMNHPQDFAILRCVSDAAAVRAAEVAGLDVAGKYGSGTEGIVMQVVYQLARRSIVKVTVKDSAGSGVIWRTDHGIVIVSNKHLLMKDVQAKVIFGSGETADADVVGYSQQYDIGFIEIPESAVSGSILRDIYEAVPVLYGTETEAAREEFARQYSGKRILQVGAVERKTANFSTGTIRGLDFVPLFNTNVLETECYSRAGMSGGGVFDEGGRFLGMISGGEVPEESEKREAELTYSIPPALIEAEYNEVRNRS